MKKLLLALSLVSTSAFSGTILCGGTVENLGIHANDKILLRLSSMNRAIFVCNPSAQWQISGVPYATSAESCNSMLAMLMTAKETRTDIREIYFDVADEDLPESCDSWGTWKYANIRYFLY